MVLYNYVVNDVVMEEQIPYSQVLQRTGLKDQVGLTEAGYVEYFAPEITPEITAEMIALGVRNLRGYLLQESDWTQGNDSPLTEDEKTAWKSYRKELRDMPSKYAGATDVKTVIPPTPPSE